ncbi:hypothetical protein [Streptomyces sp. NPDC005209]|uniref:hypothetical protein n=1 Tax=Streptomyces sp. NPDC005209 TaxID=3156715 RepID=UPI0033BD7FAF
MTWTAALPGTALRVLRTAAGRRALHLALLVGGLFALGVLAGEQAQAAEGTPSVTSALSGPSAGNAVRGVVDGVVTAPVEHADHAAPVERADHAAPVERADHAAPVERADHAAPVEHADHAAPVERADHAEHAEHRVVTPVTRHVVRTVTHRVVRPAGHLVGTVAQDIDQAETRLPSLPASPALPVPALPDVPGLSDLPGRLLPAPVTAAPGTEWPGAPRASATKGTPGAKARTARPATTTGTYGPDLTRTALAPAPRPAAHTDARGAAHFADAPTYPAPTGDLDGAPGKAAVDGGGSRHGDVYAVTLNCRAPLRLVPGVAACVDAAGTRDRHRDIPVFPG